MPEKTRSEGALVFSCGHLLWSTLGDARSSVQLGGASVTVKDFTGASFPADMSFAAFGQATVTVTNGAGASAALPLMIASVAPALFTADSSGSGAAAAEVLLVASNGTTSVASTFSCSLFSCVPLPISLPSGSQAYLILYGTGIRGRSSLAGVTATLGGKPVTPVYAGPQGLYPALDQINVPLPATFADAGAVDLVVTVDGVTANTVRVAFQ